MKRWIVIATVVIVAAAALFIVRRGQLQAKLAPQTVAVTRGSVAQEALALGSLVPQQEVSVKSKLPGIVARVHAAVGDFVREGDPLIDVRPDPTPLERTEAERNLQMTRVTEEGAQRDLNRASELSQQGLLSEKDLEAARQNHETARLQAQLASERLELLRSGRASIEGQELSSRILAPATGTILTCDVHPGDPVVPLTSYQAGTVLMTMADMQGLIFRGTVDEVDVGRLSPGQPVNFTVGAIPKEQITGVLQRISPKARKEESTTLFDVEAQVTEAHGQVLRAGYSATARIVIERADSVLVLPERVVHYAEGRATVRMPGQGKQPVEREIKTGLSDGLTVVVTEGLNEGDLVLEPERSRLERE